MRSRWTAVSSARCWWRPGSGRRWCIALISLLALNGLLVSEATGADIEHLGLDRGHRTLTITRKGGKVVTIGPVGSSGENNVSHHGQVTAHYAGMTAGRKVFGLATAGVRLA